MAVISSNIKLSALLLFALLSNSACAQEKYNSVLSLPMTLPGEEILDPSSPKISDWYQSCKRAEDTKNARDWGSAKGIWTPPSRVNTKPRRKDARPFQSRTFWTQLKKKPLYIKNITQYRRREEMERL